VNRVSTQNPFLVTLKAPFRSRHGCCILARR
jgi:hypothetical protein